MRKHIWALMAVSMLVGCGGGGDVAVSPAPNFTGNTAPATVDDTNAEEIGTTAGEATNEAINTTNANEVNPFAVEIVDNTTEISATVTAVTREAIAILQSSNLATGIVITSAELGPPFCGGSITVPDDFGSSGTLNGSITYTDLCFDDPISGQIFLSGSMIFTETATQLTIAYSNFAFTMGGETSTLNATLTCDTSFISCTLSSEFFGADGTTHRISDVSVSGDASIGYIVDATFFHSVHGAVTITTPSPITFGGCGAIPDGGTISFSSSDGSSGSITFNSDCSYTGTYDNGAGSVGSFSGSFN